MACPAAGSLFLILYGITAVYFSGVMVRLMLVLAPAVCCLAGVAISDFLTVLTASLKASVTQEVKRLKETASSAVAATTPEGEAAQSSSEIAAVPARRTTGDKPDKKDKSLKKKARPTDITDIIKGGMYPSHPLPPLVSLVGLGFILLLLLMYNIHCIGVSADMYSAPSIVLQSHRSDGSYYVFDDFREAYAWLRHNTHPEAKVASW